MSKITAYNSFTTVAENDLLVGVDVSDTTMASTGTDKKITYSQLNAVDWINVVTQYGADPTGAADRTTAIQNAINAAVTAGGGVVYIPAGTYKIAGNISKAVTNTPVYIIGAGRWCTFFSFTGTGDCIRLYDTQVANTSVKWGGCIKGITIDGTSHTSTAATGIHIGDLFQYELDIAVQNFTATGDIGAHLDNQYYYMEQLRGDIFISNCTNGVSFDANSTSGTVTGSFYRANLNIWLNQNTYTYNGVTFLNGTYIQDGALHIRGNFTGSAFCCYIFGALGSWINWTWCSWAWGCWYIFIYGSLQPGHSG